MISAKQAEEPGLGGGGERTKTSKQNKQTKTLAGAKASHFKNNASLYEKQVQKKINPYGLSNLCALTVTNYIFTT